MIRNLAVGTSGIDVKAVQQALNIWMPDQEPLDDDGKFGPKTRAAVLEFQRRRKLKRDGIVGPYTLTALYPVATYQAYAVVLRTGPTGGPQFSEAAPLAAPPQSVALEYLPGIPLRVPVPQTPAQGLAGFPTLPGRHRQLVAQVGQAGPSPPPKSFLWQYQANSSTTWPIDFSKSGVNAVQLTAKGLWLLGGKALTASVGLGLTDAVNDGAKDSGFVFGQIAWAPTFLQIGDLASLSIIAQLAAGVFALMQPLSDGSPSFFDSGAINLKLVLPRVSSHSQPFVQFGVTATQDNNSGTLGLHAPSWTWGLATGFIFQ